MIIIDRKAKKKHICTLCGLNIAKGETYNYATIAPWDHSENDGFDEYKAHSFCNYVWHNVGDNYDWIFPDELEFRIENLIPFQQSIISFIRSVDGGVASEIEYRIGKIVVGYWAYGYFNPSYPYRGNLI